ncbi:CD3324 family protein [Fusobacterium sp.]|uniref:CD3324 family protein n=1 Tax=Fusobacterium sp. TaxID=68766 RepID=UPI002905375F|nr:CD3324 family protein [Fusobacterium sp.]MDU1912022.1 CD3324 family protein [Fusobacterium sp.]
MKYINADIILPEYLIQKLQEYAQGKYIYIPIKKGKYKKWGEVSGYKKEIEERNKKINKEYRNGISVSDLSKKYYLSVSGIRKILYKK